MSFYSLSVMMSRLYLSLLIFKRYLPLLTSDVQIYLSLLMSWFHLPPLMTRLCLSLLMSLPVSPDIESTSLLMSWFYLSLQVSKLNLSLLASWFYF